MRIGGACSIKSVSSKGKCQVGESLYSLDFSPLALCSSILIYFLPLLLKLHIANSNSLKPNPKISGYFMETNKLDYANNLYFLCILLFISKISKTRKIFNIPSLFQLNLAQSLAIICLPINFFNHSIVLYYIYGYPLRIYCDIILRKMYTPIVNAFSTTFSIASLLLFLIVLANVSILNPGPEKVTSLNCYFQNVQGFCNSKLYIKTIP